MEQFDFTSRVAFHQRQAISSALVELGCMDAGVAMGVSLQTVDNTPIATAVKIEPAPLTSSPKINNERRIYQVLFMTFLLHCSYRIGSI